jgi:ribosomal protein S12 methylthiotransferase
MVKKGIRELIIVAQDITRYGQDSNGEYDLVMLLKELCRIPDLKWIRLMYCYPDRITKELIDLIATEEKICSYMDIPIQHIHPDILSKMNRVSKEKQIRTLLKSLRERIPGIVIRTSLIVGFPGEGESEFQELMDFVGEGYFNHIGVFPYSREEGTRAAEFPDQVEEPVKEERRIRLMSVQRKISRRLMKARVGQNCEVLVEGRETAGLYYGRSYGEAPEVDGLIYVRSSYPLPIGNFVDTVITKAYDYDLLGEVYESCK